jgi:hypothetical protein
MLKTFRSINRDVERFMKDLETGGVNFYKLGTYDGYLLGGFHI